MPSLQLLFTATDNTQPTVRNLISSLADLGNAYRGCITAAKNFASNAVEPMRQAFRFQDAAARLAPLVGGMDSARALAEKLRTEAANGTQSFESLAAVAGKLSSVFSSSANIEKWTRAFHDLSAGLGSDINGLVENFVKAKASGRFEGGFLDMFAAKGVNLFVDLQRETGKTGAELRKMAITGELSFSQVEKAILATVSAGGAFEGQAAALSNTTGGSIQTLVENWRTLQAVFAEPIADALTPVIQKLSRGVERLAPAARKVGEALSTRSGAVVAVGGLAALGVSVTKGLPSAESVAKTSAAMRALLRSLANVSAGWTSLRVAVAGCSRESISAAARLAGTAVATRAAAVAAGAARVAMTGLAVAVRAIKYAIVSSGIGLALVAVGEAAAWALNKFSKYSEGAGAAAESAEEHAAALAEIPRVFRDVGSAADVRGEKERQLNELIKERSALEKDEKLSVEEYAAALDRNSEKIKAVETAAAARLREIKTENARRERDEARARAESAREKIDAYERELAASKATVGEKIRLIEQEAAATTSDMRRHIALSREMNEMTAEEEGTYKRMLDALKKIDALETARAAAADALEKRIELLRAEIESEEKLAAVKEKNYRAELRQQFLAAGKSAAEADAGAAKVIALEKQAEAVRDERKKARDKQERDREGKAALEAERADVEILRARAAGNTALEAQLESEKRIRTLVASLKNSGADEAAAVALATEKVALEEALRNGADAVQKNSGALIWKNGRIVSGARTPARTPAPAVPQSAPLAAGGTFPNLIAIQSQIRDNTAAAARGIALLVSAAGKPTAAVLA